MTLAELLRSSYTQKLTGRLRWVRRLEPPDDLVHGEYENVLQQEWRDTASGEREWRDVPVVVPEQE